MPEEALLIGLSGKHIDAPGARLANWPLADKGHTRGRDQAWEGRED